MQKQYDSDRMESNQEIEFSGNTAIQYMSQTIILPEIFYCKDSGSIYIE